MRKKLKFFLAGAAVLALPAISVSCLYENDKTIKFARTFLNENAILEKQKSMPKHQNLVVQKFLDALYSSNLLTYTFSDFDYRIKANISGFSLTQKINGSSVSATEDEIRKALEEFLKDTPFYASYLVNKNTKNDYLKFSNDTVKRVNFSVPQGIFNTIPTFIFNPIEEKYKSEFLTLSDFQNNIEKAYQMARSIFREFSFFINKEEDNKAAAEPEKFQSVLGINSGFGATYLIDGVNPSTRGKDDGFKVLDSDTLDDPELQKLFLSDYQRFVSLYPHLLFFESITSVRNRITSAQASIEAIEKTISSTSNSAQRQSLSQSLKSFQDIKDAAEKQIEKFNSDRQEMKNLSDELVALNNSTNADENLKKQKQDELDKLVAFYQEDIDKIKSKFARNSRNSFTDIYHLNELFAKILFTFGAYKTQIIRGSYQEDDPANPGETKKQTIWWLEVFDYKDSKWKIIDVYKDYLMVDKLGEENSSNNVLNNLNYKVQLYISLPSNYKIDSEFKDIAHIKSNIQ